MQQQPINIIRDPQRKCCATCHHARLISYATYDPLLAECLLKPKEGSALHPYTVMVANNQVCWQHDWRKSPAVIYQRQKRSHAA